MHKLTVRSAFAAMADCGRRVGHRPPLRAQHPSGPCEEVTYVGVCEPFHQQQTRSPSQQGMGEVILPGIGNNPVTVG